MVAIPYGRRTVVATGVTATFLDAGHVLGSAIVVLDIDDEGAVTRLVFTGDLGRPHLPILRDPQVPDGANCLLMESTYGDRLHGPLEQSATALAETISRTVARGGKVIIPSFALERAQEVIFELKRLRLAGRIPLVPVYVDSPLTVKLTEVFRRHPDCYDRETFELLRSGESPFDFEGLEYVSEVAKSKAIDAADEPCVIISASGMCEGGRVLHHLRMAIENERNTVLTVGFQAQHTLGRRLVERRREVRIFGLMHPLSTTTSTHADQRGLVEFAEATRKRGQLQQVILVHGELPAQKALAGVLDEHGFPTVHIPEAGTRLRL